MDKILDILIKLSPLAYLTLGWTIWSYFLQKKHKRIEKRNDEIRVVLVELLVICNEMAVFVHENLYLLYKKNYPQYAQREKLRNDPVIAELKNIIIKFEEDEIDNCLNNIKDSYTPEELDTLKTIDDKCGTIATHYRTISSHTELMLDNIDMNIDDFKRSSEDLTKGLESTLRKLNLVNIDIVDNPNQIKEKLTSLMKLIFDHNLAMITGESLFNSKLVDIVICGNSLITIISERIKQL